jgi:hypothetical protein
MNHATPRPAPSRRVGGWVGGWVRFRGYSRSGVGGRRPHVDASGAVARLSLRSTVGFSSSAPDSGHVPADCTGARLAAPPGSAALVARTRRILQPWSLMSGW